jgi:hypothetical protein
VEGEGGTSPARWSNIRTKNGAGATAEAGAFSGGPMWAWAGRRFLLGCVVGGKGKPSFSPH